MESKLFPGIQTFLIGAGQASCYALCIAKLAERITGKDVDPLEALLRGIEQYCFHYNFEDPDDPRNFFVNDPAAFLRALTGKYVTVRKVDDTSYQPAASEYIVERWERPTPKMVYSHFKLPDWDSLRYSQTVKYGKIASLRVFRVT